MVEDNEDARRYIRESLEPDYRVVEAGDGGEEFAVILGNTDEKNAYKLAQNICRQIEEQKIPHLNSSAADVLTVSIGVATETSSASASPESLIEAADHRL